MTTKKNLIIRNGDTFISTFQWAVSPLLYKPISAITSAGPVVITATAHGIPNDWPVAIVSVKGMTEINAENSPLKDSDFRKATKLSADTVSFNDINAAEFSAYVSGGYLVYYSPKSLLNYTARFTVKDRVSGNTLLVLTTESGHIVVNDTEKVTTLTIPEDETTALAWKKGVYDLEMVSPDDPTVVTTTSLGGIKVAFN